MAISLSASFFFMTAYYFVGLLHAELLELPDNPQQLNRARHVSDVPNKLFILDAILAGLFKLFEFLNGVAHHEYAGAVR
jgi:hypothetical protein